MIYYEHENFMFKNGEWIKHPEQYTFPFEYSNPGLIYAIDGHLLHNDIEWSGGYYPNVGIYHDEKVDVYYYRALSGRVNISFYKDRENTYVIYSWGDSCYFDPFTCIIARDFGEEVENAMTQGLYDWCCENALTWIGDVLYEDCTYKERIGKTLELQKPFKRKD